MDGWVGESDTETEEAPFLPPETPRAPPPPPPPQTHPTPTPTPTPHPNRNAAQVSDRRPTFEITQGEAELWPPTLSSKVKARLR